jgi:hypothetical protein
MILNIYFASLQQKQIKKRRKPKIRQNKKNKKGKKYIPRNASPNMCVVCKGVGAMLATTKKNPRLKFHKFGCCTATVVLKGNKYK